MGLTILESLSDKTPCGFHAQNRSLDVMYELIRSHEAEIEEARERGYSWKQIDEACRESWQEHSDKAAGITWWKGGLMIESCYRAVKHGITVGKASKKKAPLSLEVTVTKR